MTTLSTTELCRVLRLTVSNEFILGLLDEKPAEVLKGNPRWSNANCVSICTKLSKHFEKQAVAFKIMPTTKSVVSKPTFEYDDDDDEL